MNEEELKAKEEELSRREGELKNKEEEIAAREAALAAREADASNIAQAIKQEFEARLEAQKREFEERLKEREEVIRQLAAGNGEEVDDDSPFAKLNRRRAAQKAA